MEKMKKFMTGKWEDLILVNYACPAEKIKPFLPHDVEPDLWKGKAIFSFVGFTFSQVRFFGMKIPMHQKFGEINLRCYVKSKRDGKRGVVFIRELAPKGIMAWIAKTFYNEPFEKFKISFKQRTTTNHIQQEYGFETKNEKGGMSILAENYDLVLFKNSLQEFIVDRYLAFVKTKDNYSKVYTIKHRPWRVKLLKKFKLSTNLKVLLPKKLRAFANHPLSVYFVDGSAVEVWR